MRLNLNWLNFRAVIAIALETLKLRSTKCYKSNVKISLIELQAELDVMGVAFALTNWFRAY